MIKYILLLGWCLLPLLLTGQIRLEGVIYDKETREPLYRAHITTKGPAFHGTLSNEEGAFALYLPAGIDTVLISYLGYQPFDIVVGQLQSGALEIPMARQSTGLEEVLIKPRDPQQILSRAVQLIPHNYDSSPTRYRSFYREIVRDSLHFYSIAEAVFEMSIFPKEKTADQVQVELVKGRTSEDVRKTRLFEDLHLTGGPLIAGDFNLTRRLPGYLDPDNFKLYDYRLEDITTFQGMEVYIIAFDQKDGIKKSLEKGRIYIEKESHAIIRMESAFSPKGMPYIKHLTGADKVIAKLINVDLKRLANTYGVNYRKFEGKWYLNDIELGHAFTYKQPKKELNLQLLFQMDLLITEIRSDSVPVIPKEKRWHKKQPVYHLPSAFDEQFWGEQNYIQPGEKVQEVVEKLQEVQRSRPEDISQQLGNWQLLNEEMASVYLEGEALVIRPFANGLWLGEFQAPLAYQEVQGDFSLSARLQLSRTKDPESLPDKGFQMAGLLLRNPAAPLETHALIALGTRGNSHLKLSSQQTLAGKSKPSITKFESGEIHLKLIRQQKEVRLFTKIPGDSEWTFVQEYLFSDLPDNVQIGFFAETYFGGKGPNMYPDLLARFTEMELKKNPQ